LSLSNHVASLRERAIFSIVPRPATPDSSLFRQGCHSRPAFPSEYNYSKQNPDSGRYQSPCPNFLAGEADMNMKKMTQHGRGYSRHHDNCK
jgi:hypothetical protein